MASNLGPIIDILVKLRNIHSDMTLVQAIHFLEIANQPGEITQLSIAKKLEISDATASRNSAILGQYGSRTTPALNLITVLEDPNDRRFKYMNLTEKGQNLIGEIQQDLQKYERQKAF